MIVYRPLTWFLLLGLVCSAFSQESEQERDADELPGSSLKPAEPVGCNDLQKAYKFLKPTDCGNYMQNSLPACKEFCESWHNAMKEEYTLDSECMFHNVFGGSYCEKETSKTDGCTNCMNRGSLLFQNCCGSCYENCQPGAGGPNAG